MTVANWLTIAGFALTVILVVIASVRKHASSDARFQRLVASHKSLMDEKVRRLEADYELLHQFKNSALPEMFERHNRNIYNVIDRVEKDINRRLDRVEKILDSEGGHG